jgi:hypothetical protein
VKRTALFTLEEANAEVPRLTMLVERLQRCALALEAERRAAIAEAGAGADPRTGDALLRSRPAARALIEELGSLVQEIERSGARLKDVELGLVDFPAMVGTESAFLCWQFGEAEVAFWHREGEGFAGRRALAGVPDSRVLQ